jgi:hypothetical protein
MKCPLAPGTAIDAKRYKDWISRFGAYRDAVTHVTIESWLEQFDRQDQDLAARLLDAVDYYGHGRIHAGFRESLASLQGWHTSPAERKGKWRFAAMSRSAGESGDSMLHHFRMANGLDRKRFDNLFVSRSELFRQPMLRESDPNRLGQDDVVVLLDDFSGTGQQVCDAWNDPATSFGALLAGVGRVYLILVAASKAAREKISGETSLSTVPGNELTDSDNIFSEKCSHFTNGDRTRLLHYGKRADKRNPMGRGDCGLIVVFQHRSPNNSIPILHVDNQRWTGLFPRHD